MIITQLNLTDTKGGAAIAAFRLHKGLNKIGQTSYMIVRKKLSSNRKVFQVALKESPNNRVKAFLWRKFLQDQYIALNRTDVSNTVFSLPYPGYDLTKSEIIRGSDIINLHWIAYFQSIVTLKKLFRTGKPIVWTLHDQWAFSGGCHYSSGCEQYMDACAACPQLTTDPFLLPRAVLLDKIEYFKGANLTIVTPGQWLASCAKKSKLFKDLRVEVIPNSLETDRFYPISKKDAKKSIGVPEDSLTLLFVAEIVSEKRKGFTELLQAIHTCKKDPRFKQLIEKNKIHILSLGESSAELDRAGIPVKPLGYLNSKEKIRNAYNAADLYILSSLEDNLPNTMLEAMACATPVVAFNVGGMPDMIRNEETGALAENRDPEKLSEAILGLLFDPGKRERLGKNCRKLIEEKYALHHQAENYLALYEDLLRQKKPQPIQPGSDQFEKNIAKLDGGLSANMRKGFVKALKRGIVDAFPDHSAVMRLFKNIIKSGIRVTPVFFIILLYRLLPKKIKNKWLAHLRERV
ncbi:MAG: glycosyltransferase family 4 protein [Candidatus Aminicenantes bacterium]|nr:glycosyltransferase family 4 protein [Candidatus Aminicenantes bacterium]